MVPYGIEYNGVRFLPDRIELLSAGSPVAMVKKEDVRRITARYMFQAERPVLQLILGGLFLSALLWPLAELGLALFFGGTFYISTLLWVLIPASLGGYLVWQSLKRGQLLLVELEHSQRKFPFGRKVDPKTMAVFLSEASKLGYNVDVGSVWGMNSEK